MEFRWSKCSELLRRLHLQLEGGLLPASPPTEKRAKGGVVGIRTPGPHSARSLWKATAERPYAARDVVELATLTRRQGRRLGRRAVSALLEVCRSGYEVRREQSFSSTPDPTARPEMDHLWEQATGILSALGQRGYPLKRRDTRALRALAFTGDCHHEYPFARGPSHCMRKRLASLYGATTGDLSARDLLDIHAHWELHHVVTAPLLRHPAATPELWGRMLCGMSGHRFKENHAWVLEQPGALSHPQVLEAIWFWGDAESQERAARVAPREWFHKLFGRLLSRAPERAARLLREMEPERLSWLSQKEQLQLLSSPSAELRLATIAAEARRLRRFPETSCYATDNRGDVPAA